LLSTGTIWLAMFARPSAAITELSPIHSGTDAATSEPKKITRRRRVTGIESIPAFARSSVICLLTALLALASPISSTARSGWRFCAAATAASTGSIRSFASVESPATVKSTRAAWPSSDTALAPSSGDFTFWTYATCPRCDVTSCTAALNPGSLTVSSSLWMNTVSDCGRRPAWWSATSASWDSPLKLSTSVMEFVPIDWPIAKAITTKASHPQKAFFRCLLLQRAILAARLCEDGCESTLTLLTS
jgi:hypothetical protein